MVPTGRGIEDRAGLSEERVRDVERQVGTHGTLHDVVVWGLAQRPPRVVVDVVVQDEYTHDVVIPHEGGTYLVFDTT